MLNEHAEDEIVTAIYMGKENTYNRELMGRINGQVKIDQMPVMCKDSVQL